MSLRMKSVSERSVNCSLPLEAQVALSSVVTSAVVEEFEILKRSFELFHGAHFPWFVRCDRAAHHQLQQYHNVHAVLFETDDQVRSLPGTSAFHAIGLQKMEALEDAWASRRNQWSAVAFLDADLLITAELLSALLGTDAEVILASNHHYRKSLFDPFYGHFNSGFILTKTPAFHRVWAEAYSAHLWQFSDQVCLNQILRDFRVRTLESSNIGFWASADPFQFNFAQIPTHCYFLHVHLFQSPHGRGWIERMFALHCLKYLLRSGDTRHHELVKEILVRDESGWYKSALLASLPGTT